MVVSWLTVQQVYEVLAKHVPNRHERRRMLAELHACVGNQSFKETVNKLIEYHDNVTRQHTGG